MSGDNVVPIRRPRRVREGQAEEELRRRVEELEGELAGLRAEGAATPDGPLVTLARLFQAGRAGLRWESLARLWSSFYFAWHSEETDEFGYDAKWADTVRPLLEFLYTVWWRVEPSGLENVPSEGAALVVSNHSGVLPWDGAMVKLALRQEHPARRECRMLALDMFALLPVLAPALAKLGEVRANPVNALRLLRRGELVGVFPEGVKGVGKPFARRYKLARFGRGGFVRVALRAGAPMVPCAVVGAEEIHPMIAKADWVGRPLGLPYFPITPTFPHLGLLGVVPLPSKWTIDFAEPIPLDGYGPEAADDVMLVNRLSEQVRSAVQRMIDARLARRRSVWTG